MRFIFRADASRKIGSGHVMRLSVLAEEAISRGIECIFVGNISGLDWVSERVSNLGFSQVLPNHDLFRVNHKSDILILDTYTIPVSDKFIARKNWRLVLSIRDQVTPKYESDIELRPGLVKVDSGQTSPVILSGAEHILIRKGIGKSNKSRWLGDELRVLVVGGGSDPFGFVQAITGIFGAMNLKMEVHAFTHGAIPQSSNVRFIKHSVGSGLDLIADKVDVVFTTASTSSLEFIAREIPTGIACAVNNQVENYDQLGSLGYAVQIGRYSSDENWDLDTHSIRELLESQETRESLRCATQSLIDLNGAARVVDTLVSLTECATH